MNRQIAMSPGRGPFLVLVATLLSTAPASAQSPTFARINYPFAGNDHIVFDLNRDGRMDLVGIGLTTARVMLGNGDGTFEPGVEYPVSTSAQPQAVVAGDFNRDGVPDLMVTLNDPQIGLALITGMGDGSFNPPVHFANASGFDSPAIAAVDLDNDNNVDVVVGHSISCYQAPCVAATSITVRRGNGDGTFQPARVINVGSDTAAIGVGDFNRDGVSDLVLASSSSRVHVLLGSGDGTFAQQTLTLIPENNLAMDNTDIDVADLNGDGIDDVVVALSLNGSKTVILIGNGDGSFSAHIIQEPNIRIPHYQAVADYNGDGRLDLALSLGWAYEGMMEIRSGNGDGTFGPLVLYFPVPDRSSLAGGKIQSADFNGDGKQDIALSWVGASAGLAILKNTTGTAPPPRPSAPSLLSPTDGASTAQPVTLDWTDVNHAVSYEVQIDNSSTIGSPFVANFIVNASQATLSGLPAQRLWWRVRARNSAGVSGPFSSVRRFTPQSAPIAASLSAISFSPTTVTGRTASTGTITLTSAAAPGGAVISLSNTNTAVAQVPSSVMIAGGATRATFAATTASVATTTPVTISAVFNGVTRAATLTVSPQGQAATLTVTGTGRSGERVVSNPAGISVFVGSTGSASFTTGTSITLSVSNGRDAIWSGACSSGGDKRRTCTFTLNGNAAVTANVQ